MKKLLTSALVGALATATLVAGSGAPAQAVPGTTNLAEVLAADGAKLDKNWKDFDIAEAAITAVLDAKPTSPLALVADGSKRLTVFLPTDRAFQRFAGKLAGATPATEQAVVEGLLQVADVDTIETILLYHVVAGATLTSPKVLAAEGTKVTTAQGKSFKVHLIKGDLVLLDKDRNARNAKAIPALLDINRGNKEVAHGINRVLRPLDL